MATTHDLIVIGGGPAGYSAALYAARASLDVLVLEHGMPGGQIATSDVIDNYRESQAARGPSSGRRCRRTRSKPGRSSAYGSVQAIEKDDSGSFVITTDMERLTAHAVVVATGATPSRWVCRRGRVPGQGVSYCATCDGMFYRENVSLS